MALFTKLLLYSFLMTFVMCGAHAHDLQRDVGIVCDSQEQVARYIGQIGINGATGIAIGTTTIVGAAQFAMNYASSSAASAMYTVKLEYGKQSTLHA